MTAKYSGRIHDPNHIRSEYDIYFNDELINVGVPDMDEMTGMITREGTKVTIPDGITKIGVSALRGMANLTEVIIPDSVTEIQTYGIASATSLQEIYIPASVTSIASNAFTGNNNLVSIKCGFAEGAVTGAPWGASNAVVTYAHDRPVTLNRLERPINTSELINHDVIDEQDDIEEA